MIRVFYESGSALSSIGREIERIRVEDNCDGPLGKVARFIERKQGLKKFTLNSAVMVCYYGGAFCTNCILGECKVNKSQLPEVVMLVVRQLMGKSRFYLIICIIFKQCI